MTTPAPDESKSSHTPSDGDDVPATLAGSHVVATLQAVSSRGASWVRNSALFQWLTAEPDPEVIVIDLRETWTVGPFLRVLDWASNRLIDAADSSRTVGVAQRGVIATRAAPLRVVGVLTVVIGLAAASSSLLGGVSTTQLAVGVGLAVGGLIAMQDDRDWATLRETRPVALTIAALEPPDPPDTGGNDMAAQSQDDPHANGSRTADSTDSETLSASLSNDGEQTDSNEN